ncbi:MAG: hypothetical protein ACP5OR_05835 [Candidatus Dormibacteria bacterium]
MQLQPFVGSGIINLDFTPHYVHWGFLQISVPNLLVIILMLLVFIAAILLPFPMHGEDEQ